MDIGINQNNPLEGRQDITQLRGVCLQEFPSGRHVEEQVLHLEVTTHRTGHRLLREYLRTCDDQLCTYLVFLTACLQLNLRHRCNGSQGLTTETHRVEGKEIGCLLDLRGGMTLKGETGISLRHSLTVVNHLDRGPSGIHHQHMDGLGICIHGVFHQLLDHRGRALYHLSSCDLVGNTIRKKTDQVTHQLRLFS